MLVLSRGQNQRLIITTASGERIVVQVCRVNGRNVKLGVEADKSVTVVRSELEDKEAA